MKEKILTLADYYCHHKNCFARVRRPGKDLYCLKHWHLVEYQKLEGKAT